MNKLKNAAKAVFGEKGLDCTRKGDQDLATAITAFDMLRKNTKNIGAIHCAKVAHDNLLKQQRELKDKDFDMKVTNFRNHYTYEIKVLLVASSKGHRLHIPSDREIHFFGQP